jgi:predicted O-methyltransferase YrrM
MDQVIAPPIEDYVSGLHATVDPLLDEIERTGRGAGLPLVHPATARLLRSLVTALGARRVLEVGTAIGYSALWMGQALPPDGRLISLELDADRAAAARDNFERAGLSSQLSVIVGDAARFLHKVAGPFDLVFQDGAKSLYEPLLDALVDRIRPGGVLVTDNVLWHGEVVPGFVEPPERDPVDTDAIRKYNLRLSGDRRLLTTFLTVGDGVALSVKVAGATS